MAAQRIRDRHCRIRFFHSRSSFPMLSGEHLLRLPVLTQGSGKKFPSKAEFLTNIFEAPRRALYPSLRGPASRSGWFPPRGSPPPGRRDHRPPADAARSFPTAPASCPGGKRTGPAPSRGPGPMQWPVYFLPCSAFMRFSWSRMALRIRRLLGVTSSSSSSARNCQTLLQAHLLGGHQPQRLVGAAGPHVGQLLLLADVDGDVLAPGADADHHAAVHRHAGPDEQGAPAPGR